MSGLAYLPTAGGHLQTQMLVPLSKLDTPMQNIVSSFMCSLQSPFPTPPTPNPFKSN